jgi:hypothetical protein
MLRRNRFSLRRTLLGVTKRRTGRRAPAVAGRRWSGVSRRDFLAGVVIAAVSLRACGRATSEASPGRLVRGLDSLKLVNWYPHDAAWSNLWTEASEEDIQQDFSKIASLGADGVRVIVNPYAFGYPRPLVAMEVKLGWIVDAAQKQGLRVQLTLFDFWQDYADTAASTDWMRTVLGPYKDDPRLCFVEVQNEVDPLDEKMRNWLQVLYPATKSAVGSVPVTVSVTSGIGLASIRQWVAWTRAAIRIDFFDMHWYGDSSEAQAGIADLKAACGGTFLFIGETGRTAQPVGSQTAAESERLQAEYLTATILACKAAGLPVPAPWVWQDFTSAALKFVGGQSYQLHFGLLRLDGSKRPAYGVMRRAFA